MVNMLRSLMEKVNNMQEQTGNISREIETLRKNQKEKLEIKNKYQSLSKADFGIVQR